MRIKHILAFTLPLLVMGCAHKTEPMQAQSLPPASQPITVSEWDKVKVSSSGEIFVNKKQLSLAEFAAECQRLKKAGGAAIIYTGDGNHVLSPAQGEAIHKLIDMGVPMKAATKESDLD